MRTLLVQAPFRDTFGYSMPPPGLLRLGAELERRGLAVELEDLAFRCARGELASGSLLCESAARLVHKRGTFDLIGLSVMGATLPAALLIAQRLRELQPTARLVLGGPGTTGTATALLERFPWIDAVVDGEAEETLPELLEAWGAGRDARGVAGVLWRDGQGTVVREAPRSPLADLGTLPAYAWHLLPPLEDYKKITGELDGLVPLDSGRGCVYDCSFCTIGRYWSRRSRVLPAARLVEEVHALEGIPGAKNAYLCHDIFGADRKHALEFCAALVEAGVRPWECRARVDHLDPELIESMAAAGCYRVLLGVESAAHSVREAAHKGQPEDLDVLGTVERLGRAGIRPILSLILGLPGEGEAELEASLDLVVQASLRVDAIVSLHLPNPQPGCGLAETHGEGARPIDGVPPDMAFGAGETGPELALIAEHPDLFSSWALPAGDEERWLYLARLANELPSVLASYPRSWELVRRATGRGQHELYRAWSDSGLDFPQFAAQVDDGLVRDALAWEGAAAELGEAGGGRPSDGRPGAVVSRTRVIHLEHDLARTVEELARGASQLDRSPCPTAFAVTPTPSGVRSDKLAPGAAAVLELLREPRTPEELEVEHPGISGAIDSLRRAGLVESCPAPQDPPPRS